MIRNKMLKIYTLLDNKVEAYNQPMFFNDDAQVKDALSSYINSDESPEINPVDYDLFYLGEFDNQTGKFNTLDAPKHLINLRTLKKDAAKSEKEK